MTTSILNEYTKLIEDDHFEFGLNRLSVSERVQIAKEYNENKNPSMEQTLVVSAIEIQRNYEKFENKTDAEQVLKAYDKCAQNLAKSKDKKFDHNKYRLGRNIKSFVCGNPEYAAKGFKIFDKYLTDVDVIEPIRSCMSRDSSLIDKGFAAIHKSADSICAKASDNQEAYSQLNLVFADLYGFYGARGPKEVVDKITSHFKEFEKQMNPKFCNLGYICESAAHHAKDEDIKEKMTILSKTFREWKGKEPFEVIYAREINRNSFIDKVHQKVKERTRANGEVFFSNDDVGLLNRIAEKDDYLELKEEGKGGDKDVIARNKMLMQARRESKNEGKQ